MKIKITKNTVCAGDTVTIGQVVETDSMTAGKLIALGKAEDYKVMDDVKTKKTRTPRKKTAKG